MESTPKKRKAFADRALVTRTTSRRFRAGTRRNKRRKDVGSFGSDLTARESATEHAPALAEAVAAS